MMSDERERQYQLREALGMKRIVSISLGSSDRDHKVETEIFGEKVQIERIGTDGDLAKAISLLRELDGTVDAFGIGGIDLYIYVGKKRYILRDGKKMASAVKKTPIVDGSGLKNTLERRVVDYLQREEIVSFEGKRVLMVCAADRYGMAEEMIKNGAQLIIGDLMFGLGIPIPLYSLDTLDRLARFVAPLVSLLPSKFIYPSGNKKEKKPSRRVAKYYYEAEIIAGDFHYIKRHMPENLEGKIIITNTVTQKDVETLRDRGAAKLITTTPEFNGRSFGTNVMEALLVAFLEKPQDEITPQDYSQMIEKMGFNPRILDFKAEDFSKKDKANVEKLEGESERRLIYG
ncbi:MAG: Uncharacterized protein XD50_1286 [Clostridia bacterium 41_269]|nr:MAG: Uncharacterized protein XD50_1286 [Clostridia bacterium 41_269]